MRPIERAQTERKLLQERRYLAQCEAGLSTDPDYYGRQHALTTTIIKMLEFTLSQPVQHAPLCCWCDEKATGRASCNGLACDHHARVYA